MERDLHEDQPFWTYHLRQAAHNQLAAMNDILFRERDQTPPNPLGSPDLSIGDRMMPHRHHHRVQHPIPLAYAQYDPLINMPMYHYYNGQNGYIVPDLRGFNPHQQAMQQPLQQPLQHSVPQTVQVPLHHAVHQPLQQPQQQPLQQPQQHQQPVIRPQPQYVDASQYMGYNYMPNAPPMINVEGPPAGVFNVINPAPCFCDAYNRNSDLTECDCDVCLRLCRNQPIHNCIMETPPPPNCNNCGSPRRLNFPHNCNVCYPVGVVCCEEACTLDEIAQHVYNTALANNDTANQQRPQ